MRDSSVETHIDSGQLALLALLDTSVAFVHSTQLSTTC